MGLSTVVFTDENGYVCDDLKGTRGCKYQFYWCEQLGIVLDRYDELHRPSRRHGWRNGRTWDRLQNRDNKIPKPEVLDIVATVARQQLQDQIRFKKGW
jgi:hypothetical protein